MSEIKTITILATELPTSNIVLSEKGRGSNKYFAWESGRSWIKPEGTVPTSWVLDSDGEVCLVNLSETEIHEYTAKALKELEAAQEAVQRAEDRAESLRMFARELYTTTSLKVVNE